MMNFCPHCAGPVEQRIPPDDDRPRDVCRSCGRVHYQNPRLVVGCIPTWEDKILMGLRDIEPRRGKWTLPAGYLENGETVAAGARRETSEETGATMGVLEPYLLFDIVHINQIYLLFRAPLTGPDFHPTRESAQVRLFSPGDIPWDDIAFPVIEKTLRCYLADRAAGVFPFQMHPIHTRLQRD
jgi:ADP-ribose pyrophosphatase YjhB (NUDIX family)